MRMALSISLVCDTFISVERDGILARPAGTGRACANDHTLRRERVPHRFGLDGRQGNGQRYVVRAIRVALAAGR